MQSKFKCLGNYIRQCNERNSALSIDNILGISIEKKFIPSKANRKNLNLSNYKIVYSWQFAYVTVTSRNGDKISIGLLEEDSGIVSSTYIVFEIKDHSELLPEFLLLWFKRPELDRYARFNSWGSARETFDWDDMCNIMIPIPSIEEQKKYVLLYTGLLKNQRCYANTLDDLQLICNTYLEDLRGVVEPSTLGRFIRQSNHRNSKLSIDNLLGISIEKKFIPSKANKDGLNLKNYKVVQPRQLGYVTVTSRNGKKLSIGLLEGEAGIVSSTYIVFEVIDKNSLLPEFLYLWFKRSEFDRYARFNSWGSARETFDWDDMCNVQLPIPNIEVQKSIVTIHHTLETRKRLNSELKNKIEQLCPILMRGVVKDLVEGMV